MPENDANLEKEETAEAEPHQDAPEEQPNLDSLIVEVKADYETKIANIKQDYEKRLSERDNVIKQLLKGDQKEQTETIADAINKERVANLTKW